MKLKSLLLGSIAAAGLSTGAFASETLNSPTKLGETFANNLVSSGVARLMSLQKTVDGVQVHIQDTAALMTKLGDLTESHSTGAATESNLTNPTTIELTAAEFGTWLMKHSGLQFDGGMSEDGVSAFVSAYNGTIDKALGTKTATQVGMGAIAWSEVLRGIGKGLQGLGQQFALQRPFTEVGGNYAGASAV